MSTIGVQLEKLRQANVQRWEELRFIQKSLNNEWSPPYLPSEDYSSLAQEYNVLIERSKLNVLPLVVDALVDRLKVVGFRSDPESPEPDKVVWGWWRASHLNQKQGMVMHDAASYRDGFLLITPHGDRPDFTPISPLDLAVEYDTYNPSKILQAARFHKNLAWYYSPEEIVSLERAAGVEGGWKVLSSKKHAAGRCPIVRFGNNLDTQGNTSSEVEQAIPVQQRVHQTIMDRLLLQRAQAWRQRWASGVIVDRDENNEPINPFKTGADTILVAKSADTRFGEFSQANLDGLLRATDDDIRGIALITRTPPHYLPMSSISNISAETITALEAALESRVNTRKTDWGESFEESMQIGGSMVGVEISDEAEVTWGNLELRSEAQRVDAAVKLFSIGVPLEYLLEQLSLSPPEVARVMKMSDREATAKAKAQAAGFGVDGIEDVNVDNAYEKTTKPAS